MLMLMLMLTLLEPVLARAPGQGQRRDSEYNWRGIDLEGHPL
jgi:hypothetical protein